MDDARAFDSGFAAEFLGARRTEDFGRALAEGASVTLIEVLAFVADEMRLLPEDAEGDLIPSLPRPSSRACRRMPRKAKPTPGEA